jgi:acylphosphatase
VIQGRVQGVFFRDTLRRLAERQGVSGWARNTWEGTVEAVLEGDEPDVEAVLAFAREGPEGASVTAVDVEDQEPQGLRGFEIR